jgi:hypothetical protein
MSMRLLRTINLALIVASAPAVAGVMQPGLYETTTRNLGTGPGPSAPAARVCFTQKDVSGNGKHLPVPTPSCQVANAKTTGDKTSYDIVCTGAPPMRGHAEMVTTATAYQGDMNVSIKSASDKPDTPVHFTYEGHRVGDCAPTAK